MNDLAAHRALRRPQPPTPELQTAANEIGEALMALESGVEGSLRQSAELVVRVIDERTRQKLSLMYGQNIIDHALTVAGHTARAREAAIGLHEAMGATQRQLGVRAVLVNPGSKPDGTGLDFMFPQAAHVRAAEAA